MTHKQAIEAGHCFALFLLGVWGVVEVGSAGTLTMAFWLAWLLYAALLILMHNGSRVASWLIIAPPALWAGFSGADIVPQVVALMTGGSLSSPASIGALLITLPCGIAVMMHLWYAG